MSVQTNYCTYITILWHVFVAREKRAPVDAGGEAGAGEDRDADETYSETDIEGETVVSLVKYFEMPIWHPTSEKTLDELLAAKVDM